ncbi:hypothetical protein CU098_013976 [Rhizopus stolonifer]|uniref:Protein UNC80 C-terminal domain-containing protein n=1 Tax=Rhizopus stolonifer TaxID=4846 RepID=A0A367KYJ1_RHIST|nr:hypothetical protein CU098_013976 [Rhizopus stolonifer]
MSAEEERTEPSSSTYSFAKQHARQGKKNPLSHWEKLRENVNDLHENNLFTVSSVASSSSSSSRNNFSPNKNKHLNPFMRSATLDPESRPTLANTALVAAQAAGMSQFTRNFRPTRHQNGVIYATLTGVQQDTYRLERDLDKLLAQLNARSQYASFAESLSTFVPATTTATLMASGIEENNKRQDVTKISFIMSAILESIKKHKSATRLPLTGELLAVLATPFDRSPLLVSDCEQALDMFDYIRDRFTQLDVTEYFEQLQFLCRLLGLGNLNLKKRILDTLRIMLLPCARNPSFLPSTPTAYHSIVYTLTNALVNLDMQKYHNNDIIKEHTINDLSAEESHIQSDILKILDSLSNGTLIPPMGKSWSAYHSGQTVPVSIARFCVIEGLVKSIMVDDCTQHNPHIKTSITHAKQIRDRLILKDLLERYWIEPENDTKPAYLKIVFLISELACEAFFVSTIDDLKNKMSTASMLLSLLHNRLSPTTLHLCLVDRHTNESQKTIALNIVNMLLALLSITSLEEKPLRPSAPSHFSSPNLSPRPSMPDFANDQLSISDIQSIHSNLELNTNDTAALKIISTIKSFVEEFWHAGYKDFMIEGVESMHQDTTSDRTACAYQNLVLHLDPVMGDEIAKKTLPTLFEKLVDSYPPITPGFCAMIHALSKKYRLYFYKPVVACAASNDEDKVTHILALITCLYRYVTGVQFWMQDAEMINVLLLSDIGQSKKKGDVSSASSSPQSTQEAQWGSTTLGQCVIAMEFMWTIKSLRAKQQDPHRDMEEDEIAKKFLIDLERRLAVFLAAKEKTRWVPMPLRIILCNIFFDIRFFCNTTHRPGWLARMVEWATQPVKDIHSSEESLSLTENTMPALHAAHISDVSYMFQRIHSVYLNVVEQLQFETISLKPVYKVPEQANVPRHQRQQTIQTMYPISRSAALSLNLDPPHSITDDPETEPEGPALKLAKYRFENMEQVNQDPFGSVFSLLAAVFTTLSSNEFGRLVKPLWERHMDDRLPQSFIPAVFLLMQCGEKIPKTMIEVSTHDFYSGDPLRRLTVIQKHSSLEAFRFNVLSQEYIPISSRRRPFRGDGGAFSTPFVPTDLGSNQFTLDEPRWMAKLKNASNFPIELKRQIQELGWDDDDNGEEHEALKKVLIPLALLPSLFLEEEEERLNEDENPTTPHKKSIDISKIIARRKRATTIHSFTISFLSMVDLLNDDFGGAANALRELLEHYLRDDPALFSRAFINDLGKFKIDRHRDMLTRVRSLISIQHKLPPGFTHILLNYLAGMLKWLVRENKPDGLVLMTLIHPILAELILSTNDLSIRDLRKNKIEHLLVSTGRFWFTHEQPANLFPRYMSDTKSTFQILDIPPEVFSVGMLRISHIQFLTNYLIRYPREVYAVKKTLQDYEPMPVPGRLHEPRWVSEEIYYPDTTRRKKRDSDTYLYQQEENLMTHVLQHDEKPYRQEGQQKQHTETLSALRARIWLRFIDNLLNGLNRNYNDRDELERILQGINTIITEHNRDFGILGQALILYTRVVTRFKRLFSSNRGYTIFLPALFKIFCEADCFPQIRSAIIFAWCRFYAVHEESFVFQMLGTLVPTTLNAFNKSDELGDWMLDNMFVLMQAMHDPPNLGATSDVLGLQLQVELDDHERTIQERIDAASNPMAIPLSTTILKPLARSVTTPIAPLDVHNYNNRSFELQNFIKLFLTIIAYDVGSLRAEQFVKIFRHMIPRFHRLVLLRDILDEGIAALIDVFVKFSKHAKVAVTTPSPSTTGGGYQGVSSGEHDIPRAPGSANRTESAQHAYGKQWQQNDKLTVRMEFVLLVHEYLKHEGILTEVSHEKMAQIIRTVMRDYSHVKGIYFKTDWLKDYLVDCLHSMVDSRNHTKAFKKVLNIIFSQYRSQWKYMDASDLYHGLAIVLEKGQGKPVNMHDIAGFINEKFVPFGMNAAIHSNWENDAKGHNRFCNALVRLVIAIMENSTQDVLAEIENQTPTPGLICYILVPICLQYNLQWDYSNMPMSNKFRPDPTSNWMRLLNYVSRACSQAFLLKSKTSGFLYQLTTNQDSDTDFTDIRDRKQTPQSVALLFSFSFVAIKIILVRASSSFNKLKDAWVQVAYFIKNALVFGQTLKFLKAKSDKSPIPSTPVTAGLSPSPHQGPLSPGLPPLEHSSSAAFSFTTPLNIGTIYDFTTWRFLEFVTIYRCPLLVLLKDFIHEKLLHMGGNSSHNRSSLYAPPSPRISIVHNSPHHSSSGSHMTRWKSWGGLPSSPPRHTSIRINVQDTEETCGLGLHIPPPPSSPSSVSNHDFSDHDSSHSPMKPNISRPLSSVSVSPLFNSHPREGSTVLHILHAESITSVVHVQIAMGFKPSLPWMAAKRHQLKPWSHREAVHRFTQEWQLLLQLYLEVDHTAIKSQPIE